jgi:CheY-like chemotaxis protein/HPt (histidine-containing phosphotransfer) domain-containing protein
VDVANNGSEAIKALKNNDYALVFMDCMMPVMSGYEATAVIRDQKSKVRNHAIPVIALTANVMREDRDKCLAAGMDDYLAKPLEFAELQVMLERWIPSCFEFGSARPTDQVTIAGGDARACVSNVDVFDMDEFVRRNLGDLELSYNVATVFIDNATKYINSIHKAVAARDAVALRQSAHKLRGAAANLALPLLSEIALMIESIAEAGNLEKATELLPTLEQRVEQAVEILMEVLRDLEIIKLPFMTRRGDAVGSPAFRCYIRDITRLPHGRPAGIAPTINGKSINSTSLTAPQRIAHQ